MTIYNNFQITSKKSLLLTPLKQLQKIQIPPQVQIHFMKKSHTSKSTSKNNQAATYLTEKNNWKLLTNGRKRLKVQLFLG